MFFVEVYGVKILKILPLLSIIFAVVLSLSAVAALGDPAIGSTACNHTVAPTDISVIGVAKAATNTPVLDLDKIEAIINKNRVFDSYIYDTDALIDEAEFVLSDQIETVDGKQVIKCETVNKFITELYGRTPAKSDNEYYEISGHGYTEITQRIIGAELAADGTVTVTADMHYGDEDCAAQVVTTLAPAANSFGYIILSAEIIE